MRERQIERGKESWLQGYKTVSMPNLTEHEIFIMLKMLAFLHLLAEEITGFGDEISIDLCYISITSS